MTDKVKELQDKMFSSEVEYKIEAAGIDEKIGTWKKILNEQLRDLSSSGVNQALCIF